MNDLLCVVLGGAINELTEELITVRVEAPIDGLMREFNAETDGRNWRWLADCLCRKEDNCSRVYKLQKQGSMSEHDHHDHQVIRGA